MITERTPTFLMANLGVEVERIVVAKREDKKNQIDSCFKRALDILHKIKTHIDMKKRARELDILNDLIVDLVRAEPLYQESSSILSSYFQPFITKIVDQLS